MTAFDSGSLYSASDLLGFLGCQHKTFLDLSLSRFLSGMMRL